MRKKNDKEEYPDQYDTCHSHQTTYNIRNRSTSRESKFANRKLKYKKIHPCKHHRRTLYNNLFKRK